MYKKLGVRLVNGWLENVQNLERLNAQDLQGAIRRRQVRGIEPDSFGFRFHEASPTDSLEFCTSCTSIRANERT